MNIDWKKQEDEARREAEKAREEMGTEERRKTRQMRVSERWHRYAKWHAQERHMRISEVADEAFRYYSGVYRNEKKLYEEWIKKVVPNVMREPYHDPGEAPGEISSSAPLPS